MRYAKVRHEKFMQEKAYRIYVTDWLYGYAQNKTLSTRYAELLNVKPMDTRTGDEITLDIIKRIGLEVQ